MEKPTIVTLPGDGCGLAAHYFEEITTQELVRRVDFAQAVHTGE